MDKVLSLCSATVSVSGRELNDQIALVRSQNRLGADEKGFEDVLKDNFGWTINDFKRSLKQEMLAQKLIATTKLNGDPHVVPTWFIYHGGKIYFETDTDTQARAQTAYNRISQGAKFESVAKKYSDDKRSASSGGEYGFLIDKTNRDLSAQVTQTLFMLKPGQISGIINTGYTLEIVKSLDKQGSRLKAAHIVFSLQDINTYLNSLKDREKAHLFVRL